MSWQNEANRAMKAIFDMFKREQSVEFYKSPDKTIVVKDPNWNADFGNPFGSSIQYTPEKKSFQARIWWMKEPQTVRSIDGEENLNISVLYPMGSVRIQVESGEAVEWLKDGKSFWIMGEKYRVHSDWRGVGMLGEVNRFELVLVKDQ